MKTKLLLFICLLGLTACASTPQRGADSRDEELAYLKYKIQVMEHQQKLDRQGMGPEIMDSSTLVERVCISTPIYDAYGYFIRTSVKCK